MIRSVPNDGIVALYLTSHKEKPLIYKNGSVVYEIDTKSKYFFDEENKTWLKYSGPDLHFYLKTVDTAYCYFGLDSDTKPTDCGYGSIFVEMNTSKAYTYSDSGWDEVSEDDPTPAPTPEEFEEEIQLAIELINALPDPNEITKDDRDSILAAEAAVSAFLAHYTAKITNYDKLLECEQKLKEADSEDAPEEPIDIVCTFTNVNNHAIPTSDEIFVYKDGAKNGADVKSGTYIIDGVEYVNNTLKVESQTGICFHVHADCAIVAKLFVAPTKSGESTILVDGGSWTLPAAAGTTESEAGIIVIKDLAPGCHTISKGSKEVVIGKIELLSVNAPNA